MTLTNCKKPNGNLIKIDKPIVVRGKSYQSYRKDLPGEDCEYYEHNQTDDKWMRLESEFPHA